ncbi:S9 family peptidase [Nitriliruptoraceae bacterium ZYF776]|nr:S9 family peptidase [Profundirhabdus halotolerans]
MPAPTSPSDPATPAPTTTRTDGTRDRLHGVEVADPYRWLEDPTDDEVRAWVAAQNAASGPVLAALPARGAFRDRLERLWRVPRRGVPWRRGDRWFQLRNDGTQDQDVLWSAPATPQDPGVAPAPSTWTVLVDPNTWSEDGTASLQGLAVTDTGTRLAVGRQDAGSDWVSWSVVDVAEDGTPQPHDDEVRWSKFSGAAWLPDGRSFLYGAYDPPPPGQEVSAKLSGQQLRRHTVGTDPADDPVVHARPDQPEWGFGPHVSHDGRWLLVTVWHGTHPETRVHVARIDDDGTIGEVGPLLDAGDARYDELGVLHDAAGRPELVVVTDHDAPLGRVVGVPLPDGDGPVAPVGPEGWRELVAEDEDRLEGAQLVGGAGPDDAAWLVCRRLRHATSHLVVHGAHEGEVLRSIELPELGTVGAVAGGRHDDGVHLGVTSFVAADTVLHHELASGRTTEVQGSTTPAPAVPVVTEQVRVRHGGVEVPVFLVHREDVVPTGDVPTVLWGYGGFDIPVTPAFRPAWRAWVDAGGLLAVACLRGGGEYGRGWYEAGRRANRGNVVADALAVAAWLTGDDRDADGGEVVAVAGLTPIDPAEGRHGPDVVWSAPAHLGVEGRSNGGLLTASCLTAAPDRFGSAVPEVGVLDLLRFHRFTIGWAWVSDYGDPDDAEEFARLRELSPYHRLLAPEARRAYPATLVTTGDTDDRVVPAHSYKFAAALQAAAAPGAPVLLRVDVAAGHGAGKPVGQLLDERADVLAWHAHHLGLRDHP